MSTESKNIPLGQPLTYKELGELGIEGWREHEPTNSKARKHNLDLLDKYFEYSVIGEKRNKRYVLHEVKVVEPVKQSDSRRHYNKQGKLIGVGKTSKTKPATSKTESKTYMDYVYTSQPNIPVECLVPLTKEDEERHEKYASIVSVGGFFSQKELAWLFHEEVKDTGKQKQIQLSTWWQSFEWEETKRVGKPTIYTITKVFDTPRQRIDFTREIANFKEQSLEVNFILSILDNDNLHEEVSSYGLITGIKARDFYVNMGLVNHDYYYVRSQKHALSDWLPVIEQDIIYRDIDESAKRYTLGALKRLLRQRVIIDYSYTYIWFERGGTEHLATDEEHLAIENAIQETIKYAQEIGFDKVTSVINLFDDTLKDFQKQDLINHFQEIVRRDVPKFEYYCRGYKLVYLKEPMLKYVNNLASQQGLELVELGVLKRDSSHSEHTQIQVRKVNKRNTSNKHKQKQLINTVVDLPRKTNTDDREQVLGKIKQQEQIDSSVEHGDYDKAVELLYEQQD